MTPCVEYLDGNNRYDQGFCSCVIDKINKKLDSAFPLTLLIDNLNRNKEEILGILVEFLRNIGNIRLIIINYT